MLFREHRGSLEDSMKTVTNVESLKDIEKICNFKGEYKIKYYCFDDRINWNTYIVTCDDKVIGFTNGIVL